jgi:hypothetical protein
MKYRKPVLVILLVFFLFALPSCSSVSEKDIIGKWTNTKFPNLWMEFFEDMTCSGGKWSLSPDGSIKIVNPDGTVRMAKIKDGKMVFDEFGERGIFMKEGK